MPHTTARPTRAATITGRITKPTARRHANKTLAKTVAALTKPDLTSSQLAHGIPHISIPMSPISTQDDTQSTPPPVAAPDASLLSLSFEPDGPVVGRRTEFEHLSDLVSTAMSSDSDSKSIYVCGTPGTGKTYAVSKVAKRLRSCDATQQNPQTIWVNCATLSQPKDLYAHLASELGATSTQTVNAAQEAIRSYATSPGSKVLIVLDEVDFLTSSDQMVLYAAFEWPRLPNSRLVLVGIANAIDLPVRLLPWLRASGAMPDVVPFTPYDATDLAAIVEQRLGDHTDGALSDKAISLAAKKVAAGSGDARLVLDVCREAIMQMRREAGKNSIMVVSGIINKRGGLSAAVDTIRKLPVQQQLALCVAANAAQLVSVEPVKSARGRTQTKKKTTLGGLFDSFVRMCNRARVSSVSFSEFADICCNSLVHHGLLDVPVVSSKAKNVARTLRSKPVRLRVPVEDVRAGISDRGFLPLLVVK